MADISPSKDKMTDVEIDADSPITEALHDKYGANINYLIDQVDSLLSETTTANVSKSAEIDDTSEHQNGAYGSVSNSSVSHTSKTGVVHLLLQPIQSSSSNDGALITAIGGDLVVRIMKNGSAIAYFDLETTSFNDASGSGHSPSAINFIDDSAGTSSNTYELEAATTGSDLGDNIVFSNCQLVVRDIT